MHLDVQEALVVDKESGVRSEVKSVLSRIGFCVTETDDGRHALALVKTKPCLDLLVTEAQPPRIDGRTVVEAFLLACPRGRAIMTSRAEDVDTINCERTGAWIFVPRSRIADALPEALRAVGLAYYQRVVLLAENDPALRELIQTMLTESGYRVIAGRDGWEALEISRAYPDAIDLLISDISMPRMTGPQLAESMRQERPMTRILFISGCAPDPLPDHPQPWHCLEKPFGAKDLIDRVKCLLQ